MVAKQVGLAVVPVAVRSVGYFAFVGHSVQPPFANPLVQPYGDVAAGSRTVETVATLVVFLPFVADVVGRLSCVSGLLGLVALVVLTAPLLPFRPPPKATASRLEIRGRAPHL